MESETYKYKPRVLSHIWKCSIYFNHSIYYDACNVGLRVCHMVSMFEFVNQRNGSPEVGYLLGASI